MDRENNYVVSGPDILSRGFVYEKESDELIEEERSVVEEALSAALEKNISDRGKLKSTIRDSLSDYVWKKTKRQPMILPIIMEV